ncbi:conjugal transfer protein TrbL family protein [Jeotgalibaca caeni]|uniref:conjugal transfer protein TrbL family protein n=1 Tax=Jeotgalibaca caeni TaxID=3028623 RepID=UPI00237ED0F5|nr:conjugal transfer protein TrbL family protein [Jeotgalibaca caeni]MDE1548542.1 hypothetical protein [Jeotgalibaca caeni]
MGNRILEMFQEWVQDGTTTLFNILSEFIFGYDGLNGFATNLYGVFVFFGGILLVVMVLVKILIYQLSEAEGSAEADIWSIIINVLKSSSMVIVLPALLFFIMNQFVQPIGDYMFNSVGGLTIEDLESLQASDNFVQIFNTTFSTLVASILIMVVIGVFLVKVCIVHAELLILELTSVFAAVTIINDEYNYMGIWWREFLSQIVTLLLEIVSMLLFTQILMSDEFNWVKLAGLIGMGFVIIKGPSVAKSMWFTTGSGRSTISGAKMLANAAIRRR